MSLKQEMAEDRRYVADRYEEPQGYQSLQEAAEDIVRMKLIPLFRSLHYRGAFRTAEQIRMFVNIADDEKYTITPSLTWNNRTEETGEQMGKIPFVQVHYSKYFDTYNRNELWKEVIKAAAKDEWQIEGELHQEKGKAVLLLNLT